MGDSESGQCISASRAAGSVLRDDDQRYHQIEIICEVARWQDVGAPERIVERAASAAISAVFGGKCSVSLCVLLTGDEKLRKLNHEFRGRDAATNVLPFPSGEDILVDENGGPFLGDVAIAFETVRRQANEQAITPGDHLAHLTVHGVLHLLGHDHVNDGEAEKMEVLEAQILASIGIANPYASWAPIVPEDKSSTCEPMEL